MPYITLKQSPTLHQITLDDILNGENDINKYIRPNSNNTRTYYTEHITYKFRSKFDIFQMTQSLMAFNLKYERLMSQPRESLYYTFYIPKKSGGLRRIDAPEDELMDALRELKDIFETQMFVLYHTSAFAYVKGRCAIDAVRRHQQNESKWFAKLDFSNFFGSTTLEFVMKMFANIFPFSEIVRTTNGRDALEKALELCFLNGGLPQGTPISPLITNVMMIPIDHTISKQLRESEHSHYIYTRYADDIIISSKYDFDCNHIVELITNVLKVFNAPFIINDKKTHYGSSSGRNWNLGVMLNKDNRITIGHKKKKLFKAMVNNYICDKKNGVTWDKHDVQTFSGLISYYTSIEKDYIDYLIKHYNDKYNFDLLRSIKIDLKSL